jgi:hypothetical protein
MLATKKKEEQTLMKVRDIVVADNNIQGACLSKGTKDYRFKILKM